MTPSEEKQAYEQLIQKQRKEPIPPSWTVEEWSLEQERRAREREVNLPPYYMGGT